MSSLSMRLAFFAVAAAVLTSSPALAHPSQQGEDVDSTESVRAGYCSSPGALKRGQAQIDHGRYQEAIATFTCVIAAEPLSVDGYRGRSEAKLMLGRYSDAFRDYALLNAVVVPASPDALGTIVASYDARLARRPHDVPALTGASFARWTMFDYAGALPLLEELVTLRPNNVYANLFRGSNRLFLGEDVAGGEADFDRAIQLAPLNPHVRFVVADGYTYALPDPERAFEEASLALELGLDTPRVHAILASSYLAMEDFTNAAVHLEQHIESVTTEIVHTAALDAGDELDLDLAPGRTYEIPVEAVAGQRITIATDGPSGEIYDSILVLFAPDGSPVTGSDDYVDYFAGLDWVAPETGTYTLWVTSFEGVSTGQLVVTRD